MIMDVKIQIKNKKGDHRRCLNSRGMAIVEVVPLLVIFIMLVAYSLGFFGVIHTAILQSISSRTYAFETFRNRTDLVLFRDIGQSNSPIPLSYKNKGVRLHSVGAEDAPSNQEGFFASRRPLAVGYPSPRTGAKDQDHLDKIFTIQPRNQSVEVGPVWIMITYGICLDSTCGGS
ncbi:MAG: hypothetical protein K1X29_08355 [Bdellovibrionales bacterium]|nr:hypothetical protein [Bdellovibrionales bacterium]